MELLTKERRLNSITIHLNGGITNKAVGVYSEIIKEDEEIISTRMLEEVVSLDSEEFAILVEHYNIEAVRRVKAAEERVAEKQAELLAARLELKGVTNG
ncbi:MAG: hypothetical protein LC687_07570 [Actinobacteria bacterium]|nr:hypothetical protein [Actinomycetota bacterium]